MEEEYSQSLWAVREKSARHELWMGRPTPSFLALPCNSPCFTCDVAGARLRQAWDALARPRSQRRHRAFPRHQPRGKRGGGDLAETGLHHWVPGEAGRLPAFAAVTSAVLPAAAPAPGRRRRVPARPPPGIGTPLLLLPRPSSSSSSVSQGKAVASFCAPHPRLGNPLSCLRHPFPGVPAPASPPPSPPPPRRIWVPASERRALHRLRGGQVSWSPAEGCSPLPRGLRGPRPLQLGRPGLAVPTGTGPRSLQPGGSRARARSPLALQEPPPRDPRGKTE